MAKDDKNIINGLREDIARASGAVKDLLSAPGAKEKYGELVKGPSFYLFPKLADLVKKFKCADQIMCLMDKHNPGSGCFLTKLSRKVLNNYN
jgi:hypothetical protein